VPHPPPRPELNPGADNSALPEGVSRLLSELETLTARLMPAEAGPDALNWPELQQLWLARGTVLAALTQNVSAMAGEAPPALKTALKQARNRQRELEAHWRERHAALEGAWQSLERQARLQARYQPTQEDPGAERRV